jgi:uncharacterized protein (DUF433 family)
MKKILATLVTAAVLGAGGMAVASAAAPTSSSPSATKPAPKAHRSGVRTKARRFAFKTAADTIGIAPADLLKAMKGNHSIADVAASHHVARQTVIDAIVSALDARIDKALADGKITTEQATNAKAAVATRAPKFVDAKPHQIRRHASRDGALAVAAKTIGVTPDALKQAIVDGQSVSEVAAAHHVDSKTVVDALVAAGNKRIDAAAAKHHWDAARVATLKAKLPQFGQRFVDFKRGAAKAKVGAPASGALA